MHPNFEGEPEQHGEFTRGFTPSEFAKIHRVHKHTVYAWIARGLIKALRVKVWINHRYVISCFATPPRLKSGPIPKEKDENS